MTVATENSSCASGSIPGLVAPESRITHELEIERSQLQGSQCIPRDEEYFSFNNLRHSISFGVPNERSENSVTRSLSNNNLDINQDVNLSSLPFSQI